jgi:hypothetical protein
VGRRARRPHPAQTSCTSSAPTSGPMSTRTSRSTRCRSSIRRSMAPIEAASGRTSRCSGWTIR